MLEAEKSHQPIAYCQHFLLGCEKYGEKKRRILCLMSCANWQDLGSFSPLVCKSVVRKKKEEKTTIKTLKVKQKHLSLRGTASQSSSRVLVDASYFVCLFPEGKKKKAKPIVSILPLIVKQHAHVVLQPLQPCGDIETKTSGKDTAKCLADAHTGRLARTNALYGSSGAARGGHQLFCCHHPWCPTCQCHCVLPGCHQLLSLGPAPVGLIRSVSTHWFPRKVEQPNPFVFS